MIVLSRDELENILKTNVAIVTFTKGNGEERILKCTLRSEFLPKKEITESTSESKRKYHESTLSVWDIENSGWRSFRLDTVKSVDIQLWKKE